jgi:hypothetical protein
MTPPAGNRYVGHAHDNGRAPQTWHVNPECGALAGREVSLLTPEFKDQIERFTGKLLRPCRLCSK